MHAIEKRNVKMKNTGSWKPNIHVIALCSITDKNTPSSKSKVILDCLLIFDCINNKKICLNINFCNTHYILYNLIEFTLTQKVSNF